MLDFTLKSYAEFLAGLAGRRRFPTFRQMAGAAGKDDLVLLRHDVDFCPRTALDMAELEAGLGIASTYFFLLSSPHYNLMAADLQGIPARIAELGHEVGLHYDVQALRPLAADGDPARALGRHADLLGMIAGVPVSSIARHMPSLSGDDPFMAVAGFVNAYDPAFTRGMPYISDSARAWRDNAARMLTEGDLPPRVQLLIHPILWTQARQSRWQCLAAFYEGKQAALAAEHAELEGLWRGHGGVLEHDAREQASADL